MSMNCGKSSQYLQQQQKRKATNHEDDNPRPRKKQRTLLLSTTKDDNPTKTTAMCAPTVTDAPADATPTDKPTDSGSSMASSTDSNSNSSQAEEAVSKNNSNANNHSFDDNFDDPHEIEERFVSQHEKYLEAALDEIRNKGQNETAWIWYLLPMTPVVVQSVEQGCANTRKYALSGDGAFAAYLQYGNGMLRNNSVQVIRAIQEQLKAGKSLSSLMGEDDYRTVKSIELFARVGNKIGDEELVSLCQEVLDLHLNQHKNGNKKVNSDDPHDIEERFVFQHNKHFRRALEEIKNGKKESCWIWFLIPSAPYIVDGVQKGSPMNQKFCLYGDDAVVAYLTHKDGMLRNNYVALTRALYQQMRRNKRTLRNLLGVLDDVKAVSSMKLFARIGRERTKDDELVKVCEQVIGLHEKQILKNEQKQGQLFKKREKQLSLDAKTKLKFFSGVSGLVPKLIGNRKKKEEEKKKAFRQTWHGV